MAFPTKIARPTAFRPVRRRCPRWPRAWRRRQTKPRWPRRRRGRQGRAGVFGVGWDFSRFRHGFLTILLDFFLGFQWWISLEDGLNGLFGDFMGMGMQNWVFGWDFLFLEFWGIVYMFLRITVGLYWTWGFRFQDFVLLCAVKNPMGFLDWEMAVGDGPSSL